jgi:DNA-binding NarL/FixJ family response regulator
MTTVMIADLDPLVARGIALLIGTEPDIEVMGTYDSGDDAVLQAHRQRCDVVVMDVRLADLDGCAAARRLTDPRGQVPPPRLVLVSSLDHQDDDMVIRALIAGASGYVRRRAALTDLVSAIRHVALGHAWLDPHVAGAVIGALSSSPQPLRVVSQRYDRLTPRELEVLLLMADGLSNAEIGTRLVVSEGTVKTHVSRVLMKLAARDRAQVIALAYRSGWVRLAS